MPNVPEALAATAAGYFLGGDKPIVGSESLEAFLETYKNVCNMSPDGSLRWVAGLLDAGFTVQLDPIIINIPSKNPEEALDQGILMVNSYLVAPTLIDMGYQVTTPASAQYNETITAFVISNI